MFLFLTEMGFFGGIHMILPLTIIELFGTKRAYLQHEKPKLHCFVPEDTCVSPFLL
jgi:hypothetical protein